jgi:microcin C transport system permease protein
MTRSSSESPFQRRLRRLRRLKRGYYSFLIIAIAYASSFLLPLVMSGTPLMVKYDDQYFFPLFRYHSVTDFGAEGFGEPDYRLMRERFREEGRGNRVIMPLYPYGPNESLLDLSTPPPNSPSRQHLLGTDDRGRDVLARLAYGFNVSLTFAIIVMLIGESFGVLVGALLG